MRGEHIVLKVHMKNPSGVLCALWQRKIPNGNQAVDIALPKYTGTDEHALYIKDCEESDMDMGPYFLQAVCSGGNVIRSNEFHPNIISGKQNS